MGTIRVTLYSEVFGSEQFSYEGVQEAAEGVVRLAQSCQEEYAKDQIEREIILHIGDENPDEYRAQDVDAEREGNPEAEAAELRGMSESEYIEGQWERENEHRTYSDPEEV